jgi:hypothetical protein
MLRKLITDRIVFTPDKESRTYRFQRERITLSIFQWVSASTSGGVPKRNEYIFNQGSIEAEGPGRAAGGLTRTDKSRVSC